MSARYDRHMVVSRAAHSSKVKRLKRAGAEVRWAWFFGVLSIAAEAPVRGCFTVGDTPADARDVADMADVTVAQARKALTVARELGMLYVDPELGVERVHDWDRVNPAPKHDSTSAQRQQRYRERLRGRSNGRDVTPPSRRDVTGESRRDVTGVTPRVTPPEVKKVEEPPLTPPRGEIPSPPSSGRKRDRALDAEALRIFAADVVPDVDPDTAVKLLRNARSRGVNELDALVAYVRKFAPSGEGLAA